MIVVPLGVSSATPTANRHLPAVALWRDGRIFLFDCGENAQMQMLKIGMKRSKIDYIFITHLDGDHFFGLPGLISTLHIQRREKELTLVGPVGIREYVDFHLKFTNIDLTFDIHYIELEEGFDGGVVIEEEEFQVSAKPLVHNIFCLGYRFQEKDKAGKVDATRATELGITEDQQFKELKAGQDVTLDDGSVITAADIVGPVREGKSFVYITDTRICPNSVELAKKATFLLHEATFGSALNDKAVETMHSTAEEAAMVAKEAEVERLILTHYSARYTNEYVLYKEAKMHFENIWIANELRPVMTDPANESGIFRIPREAQPQRQSGGRPQGGGFRSGGQRGSSGGGFRGRSSYGSGGGNRGGYSGGGQRRSYGGNNDYYNNRDRGGDNRSYGNRDGGYSSGPRRSFDSNRASYERRPYDNNRSFEQRDRNYEPRDRNYEQRDRNYEPRDRNYESRPPRSFEPRDRNYESRPPRSFESRDRNYENRGGFDSSRSEYRPNRERNFVPRRTSNEDGQSQEPERRPFDGEKKDVIKPRNNFDDYNRF